MSLAVVNKKVMAENVSEINVVTETENIAVIYVDINALAVDDQPMPMLSVKKRNELKNNILKRGIRYPIQIDSNYRIIDGRNRWEIARELGFSKVPCIMCDTSSDPSKASLKYELEICRRSLTPFEESEINKEKEAFEEELLRHEFEKALNNIVPELHDMIREKFEIYKDIKTVLTIARIPKTLQIAMVNENKAPIYTKAYTKADKKKMEAMEKELEELREKAFLLDELEEKYKELEKIANSLKSGLQAQIEEKLKEREKEIAKKYIDRAPEEFQKMLSNERKKIEQEFAEELKKAQDEMVRLSHERAKYSKDLEETRKSIKEMEGKIKRANQFADKYKKQVEIAESIVKEITTPESIVDRLIGANEDIKALQSKIDAVSKELTGILKGIIKMKASDISLNHDMFARPLLDIENTVSKLTCDEIKNITKELKKFIQQ